MRAVLLAAAIFFIITGIIVAALPFVLPVALAFGLTTALGLGLALGGFLLLALTQLIHAVQQAADVRGRGHDAAPEAFALASADQAFASDGPNASVHSQGDNAIAAHDREQGGGTINASAPPAPATPAPPTASGSAQSFYIARQCIMRGLPARILSDGSIEARLEEGWLRFNNEQHLNEYLDALEDMRRKGLL